MQYYIRLSEIQFYTIYGYQLTGSVDKTSIAVAYENVCRK